MQKVKILHIIKSLGRGGAEMLLPETLKLHDPSRFKFYYIYFLPWKDQMVEVIEKSGGEVHCLSAKNNLQLLTKASEITRFCKINNIDLIHCHLPWSGFVGRIVFKQTGIPLIYTEHNIQERYHFATKMLNKISFNYQSLALGVSRDVTRSIKENIQPVIPYHTLLNGVNTEKFKRDTNRGIEIRKKYNIPVDAVVVGNIAVFREQKRLSDWINAFKLINKDHPEVYGLLVGAGPQEEEVKNLLNELGLSNRVILTGLQTDTVAFFSAMDIFMMSSAFEGLPIALLEAMSMECAVVSTKAGGVVEVIKDGEDGLLCEVGNYGQLAQLCSGLINDIIVMNQFKKAARNRVLKAFSLRSMVDSLETVYLKQLGKTNNIYPQLKKV